MSVSIDLVSTFLSAVSQGGTDERQAAGCFAGEQFVYANIYAKFSSVGEQESSKRGLGSMRW